VRRDSNTGLWPWSYDECDPDLELPPTDPPQRISACDDHDLATDGLHGYQGRGATELDVLEGAVTNNGVGSYVVGSLQLSPGIPPYFRPPMFGFPTASVRARPNRPRRKSVVLRASHTPRYCAHPPSHCVAHSGDGMMAA
jgi:hypothetical protein